jgi:hypothetical protein
MVRGESWLPSDYKYPALTRYLAAATARFALAVSRSDPTAIAEPAASFYENYDPPAILLAGRLLSLSFSLGSIVLVALLARGVAGNAAGLAAAWVAAWCPALVIRSGNASVDPQAAFFVVLALLAAERAIVLDDHELGWAVLAGAAIGCALTTKYPAALVAIPVVLRIGGGLATWRARSRAIGCVVASAGAAVIVTMPGLLVDTGKVLEWVRIQSENYSVPTPSLWSQAARVAEWDTGYASAEIGVPLLLLLLVATLIALLVRASRAAAACWALFALLLCALHSSYHFQAFRNLVPAVLPGLALAGISFGWLRRRTSYPRVWTAGMSVLPLALFAPTVVAYTHERAQLVDSRVDALKWIAERSSHDDRIWVAREAGILSSEMRRRLAAQVVVEPKALAREQVASDAFRFVVLPRSEGDDLSPGGDSGPPWSLAATFGEQAGAAEPWRYRGNRPQLLVFDPQRHDTARETRPARDQAGRVRWRSIVRAGAPLARGSLPLRGGPTRLGDPPAVPDPGAARSMLADRGSSGLHRLRALHRSDAHADRPRLCGRAAQRPS